MVLPAHPANPGWRSTPAAWGGSSAGRAFHGRSPRGEGCLVAAAASATSPAYAPIVLRCLSSAFL